MTRSPDYSKAIDAAEKILDIFNRKPAIDNSSSDGIEIVSIFQKLLDVSMMFSMCY